MIQDFTANHSPGPHSPTCCFGGDPPQFQLLVPASWEHRPPASLANGNKNHKNRYINVDKNYPFDSIAFIITSSRLRQKSSFPRGGHANQLCRSTFSKLDKAQWICLGVRDDGIIDPGVSERSQRWMRPNFNFLGGGG